MLLVLHVWVFAFRSPTNSDEECPVQPKRRLTIATQNVELSDDDSSNDAVPFPSHRESPSPAPPRNLPPQRSQIVRASTNSRLPTPPSQRLLPLLTPPPRSASTAFTTPCHPYAGNYICDALQKLHILASMPTIMVLPNLFVKIYQAWREYG